MGSGADSSPADKYAAERFIPTAPACGRSNISLRFDGNQLTMTVTGTQSRVYRYPAVSGKPGKNLKFDYSVDRQKMKFQGPIPASEYWINPAELWENAWYKLWASDAAWGDYRITIHPYPKSKTYGRGGFFIHGGSLAGSAGCIDLTQQISAFINQLLDELNGKKDCYIPLTVSYKGGATK